MNLGQTIVNQNNICMVLNVAIRKHMVVKRKYKFLNAKVVLETCFAKIALFPTSQRKITNYQRVLYSTINKQLRMLCVIYHQIIFRYVNADIFI